MPPARVSRPGHKTIQYRNFAQRQIVAEQIDQEQGQEHRAEGQAQHQRLDGHQSTYRIENGREQRVTQRIAQLVLDGIDPLPDENEASIMHR